MYTIVMDKYKNLNTTVRTTIFQQESMIDKIQFLIPPVYEGTDLSDYIVTLKYVDPNGNFHSEVLELDAEKYKDYLRYVLPVTTKLTQVSGKLTLRLTLIKFDNGRQPEIKSEHTVVGDTMVIKENQSGPEPDVDPTTTVIDKLQTNSTTLLVNQPDGFRDYVNFEDIEAFKAALSQLQSEMPTDLEIGENENLHMVHYDKKIGEGVEILLPTQFEELDSSKDGISDVDDMTPDPESQPYGNFIEL